MHTIKRIFKNSENLGGERERPWTKKYHIRSRYMKSFKNIIYDLFSKGPFKRYVLGEFSQIWEKCLLYNEFVLGHFKYIFIVCTPEEITYKDTFLTF